MLTLIHTPKVMREVLPVFFGLPLLPAIIFTDWGYPGGPARAEADAAMAAAEAADKEKRAMDEVAAAAAAAESEAKEEAAVKAEASDTATALVAESITLQARGSSGFRASPLAGGGERERADGTLSLRGSFPGGGTVGPSSAFRVSGSNIRSSVPGLPLSQLNAGKPPARASAAGGIFDATGHADGDLNGASAKMARDTTSSQVKSLALSFAALG